MLNLKPVSITIRFNLWSKRRW